VQGQVDAANSGYITLARLRLIDKQHGPGDVRIPSDLTGRYRTHVPFGHRLLLHLSDTKAPTNDYPKSLQPSKTASMNSWSFGRDDALTYAVFNDLDGTPRVIVSTETETIFDFRLPNWSCHRARWKK